MWWKRPRGALAAQPPPGTTKPSSSMTQPSGRPCCLGLRARRAALAGGAASAWPMRHCRHAPRRRPRRALRRDAHCLPRPTGRRGPAVVASPSAIAGRPRRCSPPGGIGGGSRGSPAHGATAAPRQPADRQRLNRLLGAPPGQHQAPLTRCGAGAGIRVACRLRCSLCGILDRLGPDLRRGLVRAGPASLRACGPRRRPPAGPAARVPTARAPSPSGAPAPPAPPAGRGACCSTACTSASASASAKVSLRRASCSKNSSRSAGVRRLCARSAISRSACANIVRACPSWPDTPAPPGQHLGQRLGRRLQHRQKVARRVGQSLLGPPRVAVGAMLDTLLGPVPTVREYASILHRDRSTLE